MSERICETCISPFYVRPHRESIARYCSSDCAYKSPDRGKRISLSKTGKPCNSSTKFKRGYKPPQIVIDKLIKYAKTHQPWNKGTHTQTNTGLTYFKPSHIPWNKGIELPYNVWNKGKGIKCSEAQKLKSSKIYSEWRKSVFERDNYTCQQCNRRGGKLNADHIKSFANYPSLRLAIENGRTLCEDCHRKTDNFSWKARVYKNR